MEGLELAADLSLLKVEEEIQKAEQALRLDLERFGPRDKQQQGQQQDAVQQPQTAGRSAAAASIRGPAAGGMPPGARMSVRLNWFLRLWPRSSCSVLL